jgi:hypothetical protein
MAENIYSNIGKTTGKDVRLVRAAAHHPFEFFNKVMEDPQDHRPVRFRYLGVFYVKPYWCKGLRNTVKIGPPPEGDTIWARVPEQKFGKTYINLKRGIYKGGVFTSEDSTINCSLSDVKFWGPTS